MQERVWETPAQPAHQADAVTLLPGRAGAETRHAWRRVSAWMALTDWLSIVAALVLARFLWAGSLTPTIGPRMVWVLAPLLAIAIFSSFGLYGVHRLSSAEEFRRLLLAVSLTVTTTVSFAFWSQRPFSRTWTVGWWLLALMLVAVCRRGWHERVRRVRARGGLRFRTVIVGADADSVRLAERMADRFDSDFTVIGHVRGENEPGDVDLPLLGHVDQLRGLVHQHGIGCVVIASRAVGPADVRKVLKLRRLEGVDIWVTANFPECLSTRVSVKPVGGFMALSVSRMRLSGPQALAKRAFDLVLALAGLVVGLPLLAGIALAVKLTSPGPVLFRQKRVGRGGRPFTLLKFRTMVDGAEQLLADLRARNEADGPLFKLRHDPRVTRVGRWLRHWSLDELPQLVNVVRGEMSLVGPRPALASEVADYEEWELDRLEVPPGLTGLWQVSGRSKLTFEEYVRLDLYYIENWSLAYDLFIVAKTIPMVLAGRGAV